MSFMPCHRRGAPGTVDEKLATIVAGQRPTDLSRPEAVAYDFASALVGGGVSAGTDLSRGRRAIWCAWGRGTVLSRRTVLSGVGDLNTFDVPVPECLRNATVLRARRPSVAANVVRRTLHGANRRDMRADNNVPQGTPMRAAIFRNGEIVVDVLPEPKPARGRCW